MTDNAPSERLLTRAEVEARVGLKRSAIYERMDTSAFPKPVRVGAGVRWVESEIAAWIAARIAERDMGQNMGQPLAA
jgi:prophage regulatory protein